MVSESTKTILMIVIVSAVCIIVFAYLFGIVFLNVLKEKLNDLRLESPMGSNRSSLEGFENKSSTSEEEEEVKYPVSEEESKIKITVNLPKSQSQTLPRFNAAISSEETKEKPSIAPEAINQRYRDGLSELKRQLDAVREEEKRAFSSASGIQEEGTSKSAAQDTDDDKIVVSKKFLIENFGGFAQVNPNLKLKTKLDEEYRKLFGGSEGMNRPSPDGYAALEREDQGRSVWNFDYERNDQVRNTCFRNHKHGKKCQYGPTNYADPRTMSVIEKRSFMLNYPANMTMQDYVNWLYCFANGGEDQLPYNHLKNLEKLKKGIPLVKEEGVCPPSGKYFPPLDAEKYFQTMYDLKTKEVAFAAPLNSTTGPLMGANYNQYSDFAQNLGQFGLSGMVVNPDLAYKKEAKVVDNYIIPKDSSNTQNLMGN